MKEMRKIVIEQLEEEVRIIKTLLDDYKAEIGEEALTEGQFSVLEKAILQKDIIFFVVKDEKALITMCSVSKTFSTFSCNYSGVFEDFYIVPEYRKRGIAKRLTEFVFDYCSKNTISSLWVGCADCDLEMYKHLGFNIPLGNLLTWSIR